MAENKKDTKSEKKPVAALKVTCLKESFIRAGIKWTREPKTIPVESLTAAQIAAIKAEPMLIVEAVEA